MDAPGFSNSVPEKQQPGKGLGGKDSVWEKESWFLRSWCSCKEAAAELPGSELWLAASCSALCPPLASRAPGLPENPQDAVQQLPGIPEPVREPGLCLQQHIPGSPVPQGSEASLEQSSFARGLRLSPWLCHPFEEKELKIG